MDVRLKTNRRVISVVVAKLAVAKGLYDSSNKNSYHFESFSVTRRASPIVYDRTIIEEILANKLVSSRTEFVNSQQCPDLLLLYL